MTPRIDLNCDLGESFGRWHLGADAEIMPWISSANVACGFHAGDPLTIERSVRLAVEAGVAIGAHVALPDLVGFGRREMRIDAAEARSLTLYQLGALAAFARAAGSRIHHLKPHGALYHMAGREPALAAAIAGAARDFDPSLLLVGPPGSELLRAARAVGLDVAREGFVDRGYAADGSLLPRGAPGAMVDEAEIAIAQGLALARGEPIATPEGSPLTLEVDTLCVHGDHPGAAGFTRRLRQALEAAGLRVAPPPTRMSSSAVNPP